MSAVVGAICRWEEIDSGCGTSEWLEDFEIRVQSGRDCVNIPSRSKCYTYPACWDELVEMIVQRGVKAARNPFAYWVSARPAFRVGFGF